MTEKDLTSDASTLASDTPEAVLGCIKQSLEEALGEIESALFDLFELDFEPGDPLVRIVGEAALNINKAIDLVFERVLDDWRVDG